MPEPNAGTGRYAYVGPKGTFTEAALAVFDPAACEDAVPYPSIQATLDAVRAEAADRAIVPIESSVEGAVTATLDELATGPDLAICAELLLPVTFALLARQATVLADVKKVGGHPQAQAQCRRSGRGVRRRPIRARGPGQRRERRAGRGHQVRGGRPPRPGARRHRRGPDLAGRLLARGPRRCADGTAHRVRGARHQPHPHRVPPHRRRAGQVLLLDRLRGPPRRRASRRGADGPAPGLRGREVPRQLPAP